MHLSKISLALRQWGAGAWSPASLFASGEQGAWYDPSDLTTMFQDRAGSIQVTADGQTVGLILDKSKGLVLGSELVTNGDFNNGTTGWVGVGATLSAPSSELIITSTGNYGIGASTGFATTIGKTYKATAKLVGCSSGIARIRKTDAQNDYNNNFAHLINSSSWTPGQEFTIYFVATATTSYIMGVTDAHPSNITIDNVSVKELPGNHAVAPSDAARPLYKVTGIADWNDFDAVDDVLNTTFPASLGSSCTVARANVGGAPTILTGQTIGTSYANSTDNAGLVITNDALTPQETSDLTAWLTAKGATA